MGIVADPKKLFVNNPSPNVEEGLAMLRANQVAFQECAGVMPTENLVILDGVITPTRAVCTVDTEGNASLDDLETISSTLSDGSFLHEGMMIWLTAKDPSRKITIKNTSGPDSIHTTTGKDTVLEHGNYLIFQRVDNAWRQISVTVPVSVATAGAAGIVKPGNGLSVTADGTLNVTLEMPEVPSPVLKGGIIMFSGSFSGRYPIPLGSSSADKNWVMCDGTSTNGYRVPDLRNRFIIGAGSTYDVGDKGGSSSHKHTVSGSISTATLNTGQMASHAHVEGVVRSGGEGDYGGGYAAIRRRGEHSGSAEQIITDQTGNGYGHTHSATSLSASSSSVMPPYYALAFIMRVA